MLKSIFVLVFLLFVFFVQAQTYMLVDTLCTEGTTLRNPVDTICLFDWPLKINEFCAINETVSPDEYGEYDDWIEIYNFGEDTIDLLGVYISDDFSDPQKWQFPESILILPDTFALIWADGQAHQGSNHVGFKLSGSGEEIAMFSPDSVLMIDSRVFDQQTVDVSMGRQPDGGSIWNYFDEPTPGFSNSTSGLLGVTPAPDFSVEGGFYQEMLNVELLVNIESCAIYYTLDCSVPTEADSLYSAPIVINATTVIRARAFREGWVAGPVATTTYLYGSGYSLNVISLVTQSDNFWGSSGIYENAHSGLEKPIHFEYFGENGDPDFNIDLGVKIHSPDKRLQKSLRFYARSQYGDDEINYQLFDDIPITKFKRLILRNAGNDGFELGKTNIRDPLAHIIFGQAYSGNTVSAYKPVDVYLNGQYWGIYNMRERQDEHYIESHYGETDIDFLEYDAESPSNKHIIKGNWDNFDSLKSFVVNNDLSIDSNYRHVESWMDIENFVDYQIFEIFIANQDWLSNNMKFWRPKRPDGKWKWVLWDTEFGLGLYYPDFPVGFPDFNALNMALTWGGWGSGDYTYLLRNLVENQEFLEYFNIRFADLLNTAYKENGNIVDVIDSLQTLLAPDAVHQFNRWGSENTNWENMVQGIKNFTNPRPYYCRQHIIDEFGLDTLYTLSLNISPPEAGIIEVNTISVDEAQWEGQYFTDYSTSLKAVPNRGYRFIGWESLGADTSVLQLVALGDTSLTAIFQQNPPDTSIVMNEINYNSATFFDSGDWVEIKNIGASSVNLAGWTFKDESDEHVFELPENTILEPDSLLVLCMDSLRFTAIFPGITNYLGNLGFGFSGGGEVLRLYNSLGALVDSVHYNDNFPWPELADGIGPTLELIYDTINNNWPESWRASYNIGGTPGMSNSFRDTVKLFINEFMADNDNTISDPQGEFEDWIELYNAGEQYVNVGGMFITDDLSNPFEFQIPDNSLDSTMIFPGEFLLLWADKDANDGVRHLEIKLSASGEQIGLFANDGATVIDTLTFAAQQTDVSFGRRVDGGANWLAMNRPTPAKSNTTEIVFVDASKADDSGDGFSWASAKKYLQSGMAMAVPTNEIWVAGGVYYPDEGDGVTDNDEDAVFKLFEGVKIYGGFAGTETLLTERDWAINLTILSGDIEQDDINTDGNNIAETYADIVGANSNIILKAEATTGTSISSLCEVNGLYMTAGDGLLGSGFTCHTNVAGKESSPSIVNCSFVGNMASSNGAAVYISASIEAGTCKPELINCNFSGNKAVYTGALEITSFQNGICNPTLINCSFSNNEGLQAGAIDNRTIMGTADATLINCSFAANTSLAGSAISNKGGQLVLTNCILWNEGITEIFHSDGGTAAISYCDIQGSNGSGGGWLTDLGTDVGNNIDVDPIFVDAANGKLNLYCGSPAIDAGDNAANTEEYDLAGNTRIQNGTIDLGAFEGGTPWIYAGQNDTICYGISYDLTLADACGIYPLTWTTSGIGSFDNAAILNPIYNLNGETGNITLTLTSDGTYSDFMTLFVQENPSADAGGDATIASNQTYSLSDATAENYASVSWGTSGNGNFDNDTNLNPSYTPGIGDVGTSVTLTLYVDPNAPCADQVTDAMTLTVKAAPVVVITSPADQEIVYAVDDFVEGTATDADGSINKVEVNINNGGWADATGTDTWTFAATYNHGLNVILARAIDNEGYVLDYDTARVYVHLHTITLVPGYQMISTYLDPINPDIVDIMAPVVGALDEMITLPNKIYLPSFGINTILNWNVMTAYKLRMAQAGEITIAGDPIKDNTLNLDDFAYLPVLSDQPSPIASIFADPLNDVTVILELGNPFGIYFPDGELFLLENLEPGKGYQARFNKPVTVTYPEYLGFNHVDYVPQTIESESPWAITPTGEVHVISIQQDALTELAGMDYVGAFDSEGNCIGYADMGISSGNLPMMVYGNDTYTTVKDGATEGELLNFVAYNAATGEETPLIAEFDQNMHEHNGTFSINGLSIINSLYKEATGVADGELESSIRIFPNPATDKLNIQIMGIEKVESVSIHAANGLLILDLLVSEGNIQTDVSNLKKGVYFIQIEFSGSSIVKRIVIL